jgi:hypothetical protein
MRKEKNRLVQPDSEIIYRGKMSGIEITRSEQILYNRIREEVLNDTFLSKGYRNKIMHNS